MEGASGVLKATVADGLMTFLFVFCISTLGPLTSVVMSSPFYHSFVSFLKDNMPPPPPPQFIVTTCLLFFFLLFLSTVASFLGGASFNPTSTVAFHVAGFSNPKSNPLISMGLRFPAQALGAVCGAIAISRVMPRPYDRMLGGPSLKVDLHVGAVAETVCTFLVSFGVLWIVTRGPRNHLLKVLMIAVTTVTLVVLGSGYTGPGMNPANAFAWAYVNKRHNTLEQFYVYWVCPIIGAILAASVYRFLFPPPASKVKKARSSQFMEMILLILILINWVRALICMFYYL